LGESYFVDNTAVGKRKRLFVAWIVAVVTCAVVVAAEVVLGPLQFRPAGLDLSSWLVAGIYVSAVAMCLTTLRWFMTAPKATRQITVQDLRDRVGTSGRKTARSQ
jgi:hypothetical protein